MQGSIVMETAKATSTGSDVTTYTMNPAQEGTAASFHNKTAPNTVRRPLSHREAFAVSP
ncbi:hypothetical protein NQZ68_021898 [Dissostichus eleginoides]|nr:hypothetical protein NQZ68_021898 [Dissostichus eleginoides]